MSQTVNLTLNAAKMVVGPECIPLVGATDDYFTIEMPDPVASFQVHIEAPGQPMPQVGQMIKIPFKEPIGTHLCEVTSTEGHTVHGKVSFYNQEKASAFSAYLASLSAKETP